MSHPPRIDAKTGLPAEDILPNPRAIERIKKKAEEDEKRRAWDEETGPGKKLTRAHVERMLTEASKMQSLIVIDGERQKASVNLHGRILDGVDLSGLDLAYANLCRASLRGAKLTRCRLFRANLSEADLEDADLEETDATSANFHDACLCRAKLGRASLLLANLSRACIDGVDGLDARKVNAERMGEIDGERPVFVREPGKAPVRLVENGRPVTELAKIGAMVKLADLTGKPVMEWVTGPLSRGANLARLSETHVHRKRIRT